MRLSLPLALLSCLFAAQAAAGAHDTMTSPSRALLAQPVMPVATPVSPTRVQFVQATWTLQDATCASVFETTKDKVFNNTLAKAVIQDFADALTFNGWLAAAKGVLAVRQPCRDITFKSKTYASFRVGVRFNSTNDTRVRDEMWTAIGAPGVANLCSGGYNKILYKNVAALFAKHKFTVSQNNGTRTNMFFPGGTNWIEYAAPCVPRPRPSPSPIPSPSPSPAPVIKAPVVNVPVGSTSCNATVVQALADGLKAQVTNGMEPAKAALVYVEVVDCKPANKSRRSLLQNTNNTNIIVTLSITVSPLVESVEQVDAATRAVYEAVTGNPSESLPAGASLDTVLQILNKDLTTTGGAQQLVQKVQEAIQQQNLTSVFDATVTNTTTITGGSQALKCTSLPGAITGATWGNQCLNQDPGFVCVTSCSIGGTVSATCSTEGVYTTAPGTACPVTQQPTKTCTGVPATTPEGAAWPTAGCTNQTQCTATCTGASTGRPSALCDTIKGSWSEPSGTCTPIRCTGVPLTSVANANWLTNCAITVGSTCTAKCIGEGTPTTATCNRVGTTNDANWAITATGSCAAQFPAGATCLDSNGAGQNAPTIVCGAGFAAKDGASGISIAGLAEAAAKPACCNAIYGASATCASDWKAACSGGAVLNPSGAINGLVVDSAAALAICCRVPSPPSPSPPPAGPSPQPSSPSPPPASPSPPPGNPNPSPPPNPSPAPCVANCINVAVGVGTVCGTWSDGCGSTCTATCASANQTLTCQQGVCVCVPACSSTSGLLNGVACGDTGNGCGGTCARTCASGLTCNAGTCCTPSCTGNVVVSRNQTCGVTQSNSCGGTCPRVCNTAVDDCIGGVCTCRANCTSVSNVAVSDSCAPVTNVCGGQCSQGCNSGLLCRNDTQTCCSANCTGPITVNRTESCDLVSNGCGGTCERNCKSEDVCVSGTCTCRPTCNNTANIVAGQPCTPLDNQCNGTCTRSCVSGHLCVAGICQANDATTEVTSIVARNANSSVFPTAQWYVNFDTNDVSNEVVCGSIVTLDSAQEQSNSSKPVITSSLYNSAPASLKNPQTNMTTALKFVIGGAQDFCEVVLTYPGDNHDGEKSGMFNGMLWRDFIISDGEISYKWYKGDMGAGDVGAPAIKVSLLDPASLGSAFLQFVTFSMEPYCQKPSIQLNEEACTVMPADNTWTQNTITYSQSGAWPASAWSMGPTGTQSACGTRTWEWWMQNATLTSPRAFASGNIGDPCDYRLKWDAASGAPKAGFMDRAVISSIRLGVGTGSARIAGYVAWVRVKTGNSNFNYAWQFGA